jgi:hypothetical protein
MAESRLHEAPVLALVDVASRAIDQMNVLIEAQSDWLASLYEYVPKEHHDLLRQVEACTELMKKVHADVNLAVDRENGEAVRDYLEHNL